MATFFYMLTIAMSLFLILLILIQRGRGGGLAGAFGGAGGQSAIGTRAGDVFTRITAVCIVLWFILNAVTGVVMRSEEKRRVPGKPAVNVNANQKSETTAKASNEAEGGKASSKVELDDKTPAQGRASDGSAAADSVKTDGPDVKDLKNDTKSE